MGMPLAVSSVGGIGDRLLVGPWCGRCVSSWRLLRASVLAVAAAVVVATRPFYVVVEDG